MKHLILRGNTYYYRRRIPQELQEYIRIKSYYKSLSKDFKLTIKIATKFDAIFDEALMMVKLGHEPNITQLGISKPTEQTPQHSFLTTIERSEDAQKTTVMHMVVLSELLPKNISELSQNSLDKTISLIKSLPKRNIQKYKNKSVTELLQLTIPAEDKLATRGINAYLKTLKSYLSFCYKRNHIKIQFDIPLSKRNIGSREERKSLGLSTIQKLINGSKSDALGSAYTLLYLTGMRLSEVYKCKVTMADGIQCFDLTDASIKLKTKSSYRLIPVHKSIKNAETLLDKIRSIQQEHISKSCKKSLKEGTLYSLRHSFATHLAANGVEPHIISELMGHKHETMTLNRYVKGLPVEILKKALDTL